MSKLLPLITLTGLGLSACFSEASFHGVMKSSKEEKSERTLEPEPAEHSSDAVEEAEPTPTTGSLQTGESEESTATSAELPDPNLPNQNNSPTKPVVLTLWSGSCASQQLGQCAAFLGNGYFYIDFVSGAAHCLASPGSTELVGCWLPNLSVVTGAGTLQIGEIKFGSKFGKNEVNLPQFHSFDWSKFQTLTATIRILPAGTLQLLGNTDNGVSVFSTTSGGVQFSSVSLYSWSFAEVQFEGTTNSLEAQATDATAL